MSSRRVAIAYGAIWNQKAAAPLCFMDLYQSFCLQHLHFSSLPTASAHTCAQPSQEGGKFILHKQFAHWPLSKSANQVANSDVDTCPFGTGMKTATHFLETIKHPVNEQQLSLLTAIWAKHERVTWIRQLPIP
jgi:hypothetical protein